MLRHFAGVNDDWMSAVCRCNWRLRDFRVLFVELWRDPSLGSEILFARSVVEDCWGSSGNLTG